MIDRGAFAALAATLVAVAAFWTWPSQAARPATPYSAPPHATAQAVLGGGCFWCLEASLEQLRGVDAVVSGYAGGQAASPSYEQVCGGRTGHAEVVQVTYDPKVLPYVDLLKAYFVVHDPTTRDRQGNDVGSQYRSIVLTKTVDEANTAKRVIAELQHSFDKPIVTEVVPLTTFWPAEDYHQDYFAKHPDQPYCAYVVVEKMGLYAAVKILRLT